MKKVVVTGGYGFIGSNLVKKLLSSKNLLIYNIDKLGYDSNSSFIEDSIDESNKNKLWILCIIIVFNTNLTDLKKKLDQFKIKLYTCTELVYNSLTKYIYFPLFNS